MIFETRLQYQALVEPVRVTSAIVPFTAFFFNNSPTVITEFRLQYQAYATPIFIKVPPLDWFEYLSEPVRAKPRLPESILQFSAQWVMPVGIITMAITEVGDTALFGGAAYNPAVRARVGIHEQ